MYKVLIADDQAAEREGLTFLLERMQLPFEVRTACNGRDALEMLQASPVDCLIADIKMPFMDGLTLCAQARKLRPELLTVIYSAYGDFTFAQQAIQIQVDEYLLKPVVVEDFAAVMQKMVAKLDARAEKEARRNQLMAEYEEANLLKKEKILSMLMALEVGEQGKPEEDLPIKRAVSMAVECIEQNYHKDIGLEWVASQIYLSPGYLSGLFKQETGKSVIQYITMCRMEKAKHLLCATNMRIADISRQVGISSASYFSLLFRKCYGVTAQQMREEVYHEAKNG